jgi:hypothetical protein
MRVGWVDYVKEYGEGPYLYMAQKIESALIVIIGQVSIE